MKTVTVRGVGTLSLKPDLIVVSMQLASEDRDYEKAMNAASDKIDMLCRAVGKAGFAEEAVKTVNFDVRTKYESRRHPDGNYESVFCGYVCTHALKIEFDFDTARLALVLSAVSQCPAVPEFSVSFTVKDPEALRRELLQAAAVNAREKAEILCAASGVRLGALVTIDYGCGDIRPVSETSLHIGTNRMLKAGAAPADMQMEPDDIRVSDTAAFVWEIC